jgi:hypothetical protein
VLATDRPGRVRHSRRLDDSSPLQAVFAPKSSAAPPKELFGVPGPSSVMHGTKNRACYKWRMKTNILAAAAGLSDQDLLARLCLLAGRERETAVELVAHLAALDTRPAVYAAQGYGSLFTYCIQALRLSEDAACNRIEAARACRRFPVILDLLASGAMTLTSVRALGRHLTPENHRGVLERAQGRSRQQIETLVAELAPRPDVTTSVRRLPYPATPLVSVAVGQQATARHPTGELPGEPAPPIEASAEALVAVARPIVQVTSPERYRVQFTIGQATHEKLRRVQALLRREIPDGDPGVIFDRALTLLLEKVEKAKLGASVTPRRRPSIRSGTDKAGREAGSTLAPRPTGGQTRRLATRCRPVRLRLRQRKEVLGADIPGVPPPSGLCEAGSGHGRQHLTSLSSSQSVRIRVDLRPSRAVERAH